MSSKFIVLTLAVASWLTLSLAGFAIQARYAATPGQPAIAPTSWPQDSAILPTDGASSILVFLHPHCPCSRSTLDQLQHTLLLSTSPVACHILFVAPPGTEPGWEQGPLIRQAERIPGVTLHTDTKGTEAARFRAATSGQTFLYDPAARLLFHGGITRSRAHEGESAGARSLANYLDGSSNAISPPTPVYGCPLFDQPTRSATLPPSSDTACCAP